MNDKYEIIKRATITLYILLVGLALWLMSLAEMQKFNELSYFKFVFYFFGSGFAFHFLNILLDLDANESNFSHWKALSYRLVLAGVPIVFTYISIYVGAAVAEKYEFSVYLYFAWGMGSFALGLWFSSIQVTKFHRKLTTLKEISTSD